MMWGQITGKKNKLVNELLSRQAYAFMLLDYNRISKSRDRKPSREMVMCVGVT